jgi:uncharacterized protein (TIGR02996 family)
MSEREALIRGILADPGSNVPRLVFADWLLETAEPANVARADFIRCQCAYASESSSDVRSELMRQQLTLQAEWMPRWEAELPQAAGIAYGNWTRGFPEYVWLDDWQTFRAHIDALQREAAIHQIGIRRINAKQFAQLVADPRIESLTYLNVSENDIGNTEAVAIANSQLAHLAELILTRTRVGSSGALALLAAPNLPCLVRLSVYGTPGVARWGPILREQFGKRLDF